MLGALLGDFAISMAPWWCAVMSVMNAASVALPDELDFVPLSSSPPQPTATAASAMRARAASSASQVFVFMVFGVLSGV